MKKKERKKGAFILIKKIIFLFSGRGIIFIVYVITLSVLKAEEKKNRI